ncbi:MAG: BtpA/SgcQ family protein [Vampirovibrionia bacterium]
MIKFNDKKPLAIGCVHVLPLPGAAGYSGDLYGIIHKAVEEAVIYSETGFDAIILENMHDTPYLRGYVYPETVAAMTAVACTVRQCLPDMTLGIQILSAANREALAVSIAAKLNFVRVEGYTFAHVADEGIIQSCAADLIRARDYLKANDVAIFSDIKKKHSAHSITADVSIEETAETAEFMRADGVIITGSATGKSPDLNELKAVKKVTKLPVMLGSGITPDNIASYKAYTDAVIIGSYCKIDGFWKNTVSVDRCKTFIDALNNA